MSEVAIPPHHISDTPDSLVASYTIAHESSSDRFWHRHDPPNQSRSGLEMYSSP